MKDEDSIKGFQVDFDNLPAQFPTQSHPSVFWEALGRAVATFSFLEETLGKAIFALTGTRQYSETEIRAAYKRWLPTLQRALSDPLGGLINSYEKALHEHPQTTTSNHKELIDRLREVSKLRNVLCHGSWDQRPNDRGQSIPFFVNKNNDVFDVPIDLAYLNQVQRTTVELVCLVINTVTKTGFQFPGSNGPGKPVW